MPTILLSLGLVACGPDYSPDTYATNAVQQANKVEQGVIVGVRDVAVSASGTLGAVTGGAAGGIAGSQVGVGPISAFTALGGTLVGGITGSAIEHASGDTRAFEYIVRKTGNDLVSVTQTDKTPLALGQRVLVIAGNQARVVADYTVAVTPPENARVTEMSAAGVDRTRREQATQVTVVETSASTPAPAAAGNAARVPESVGPGGPVIGVQDSTAGAPGEPIKLAPAIEARLQVEPTR